MTGDLRYLRPFFTFFGGKWKISPLYPKPKHKTVIEGFAGSAGYSLNHYKRDVVLVEADPNICSMWEFLVASSPRDILDLPDLNNGARIDDLNLPPGPENLIGFWCGRGRATPGRQISGWGRDPKYSRYYWGKESKQRIASQVEYIKHWTVVHRNFFDFVAENCGTYATWFIDPPYQYLTGNRYRFGSNLIDYPALGKICGSQLNGQVIVCEGKHAKWMDFKPLTIAQANNGRDSEERVWLGGKMSDCTPDVVCDLYQKDQSESGGFLLAEIER